MTAHHAGPARPRRPPFRSLRPVAGPVVSAALCLGLLACAEKGGGKGTGGGGGTGDPEGAGPAAGAGDGAVPGIEEGGAACTNGLDDDGDGFVDCADRDCAFTAPAGVCPPESAAGLCANRLDDDGDGFVDGADDDCVENTVALCTDGVDNDGNGYTDCEDFACSRNAELALGCPGENTDALCMDGLDNDGNRYIDCDDFGCSRNALVTVCGGGGGDGGGGDGGGGGGGGDGAACSPSEPTGLCADASQVCDGGQCVARSDDFLVPARAGDLLITEFLANTELPDVPDNESTAEWFEVWNPGVKPVDLRGVRVHDDGSDAVVVAAAEPVVVPAGGYAVLGRSTDRATNGDVDVAWAYGREITLANGADEIVLTLGGVVIDRVVYTGDWPHGSGVASARDAAGAWCAAKTPWSAASAQKGSPGQENPPCE